MMDQAHAIRQPEEDELGQESAPRPATFVRPSQNPSYEPPSAKQEPPGGTSVGPHGEQYVEDQRRDTARDDR